MTERTIEREELMPPKRYCTCDYDWCQKRYWPPTLKQRIWAKFCALAQWVRPGRN